MRCSLRTELAQGGVSDDRIKVVLNRHGKKDDLQLSDISNALGGQEVFTLPGDFERVNASINLGTPLYETSKRAQITRRLVELSQSLRETAGEARPKKSRFLQWVRS